MNIICLSNQLWDSRTPTNKFQVMSRLSRLGHNVIFVDPPINFGRVLFQQFQRKLWNLKRFLLGYKMPNENVLNFTPINFIPFGFINSFFHAIKILILSKFYFKNKEPIVVWIYHVQISNIENYLRILPYNILIYDCVDEYSAFPRDNKIIGTLTKNLEAQERLLTEKADLVFATTPALVNKLKEYSNNPEKVFWTPNVGDYEKFKNSKKLKYNLPSDIASIPRPVVGFVGALDDYKFDKALVRKIAQTYPNYSLVIIGPLAIKDKDATDDDLGFTEFKNVYFLGFKPYDDIPKYFAGFDVFIIPYVLNEYTVGGCFPIKFHDALAAGIPTVVTNLPAYEPFKKVSYISKNPDEFVKNIELALDEDNAMRMKERQDIAKENSWEKKVEKLVNLIEAELKSKK